MRFVDENLHYVRVFLPFDESFTSMVHYRCQFWIENLVNLCRFSFVDVSFRLNMLISTDVRSNIHIRLMNRTEKRPTFVSIRTLEEKRGFKLSHSDLSIIINERKKKTHRIEVDAGFIWLRRSSNVHRSTSKTKEKKRRNLISDREKSKLCRSEKESLSLLMESSFSTAIIRSDCSNENFICWSTFEKEKRPVVLRFSLFVKFNQLFF